MSRIPSSSRLLGWLRADGVAALLILILASVPFLQVTGFSFVSYDDPMHLSEQPMVLSGLNQEGLAWSLSATPTNLWHPLTWISYMVEVSWLGGGADSPEVHHLGNLLLHLGATLLFFFLLRTLRISILVAALATLLFSVHPLHVEPVAWISSRKDTLCAFFSLLSLFCYSRSKCSGGKTRVWFWSSLITLAAALTSKPSAVVLPALFVLIDYLPGEGKHAQGLSGLKQNLAQKWPHFALAGLAAVVAVTVQHSGSHELLISQQSLWSRLSLLPASMGFYIQHLLWPYGLSFDYAPPEGARLITLTIAGSSLLLGISSLAWQMRHRFPPLMLGWLWLILCLVPVLGFFYVGPSFTADRYTYLAIAGPCLTLGSWVHASKGVVRGTALVSCLLLAILLGVTSFRQTRIWQDDRSLFGHGVAVEPRSDLAQTNYARLCSLAGNDELALEHYNKALMLAASRHYIIHHNIALIQYRHGQLDGAIESCRLALQGHGQYAPAHHLLGQLLEEQGKATGQHYMGPRADMALEHLKKALSIGMRQDDPWTPKYAYSCGLAHAKRGQYQEAKRVIDKALESRHLNPADRQKMSALLEMLGPCLSE